MLFDGSTIHSFEFLPTQSVTTLMFMLQPKTPKILLYSLASKQVVENATELSGKSIMNQAIKLFYKQNSVQRYFYYYLVLYKQPQP